MFVPRTRGGELARRLKEKELELAKHTFQAVRIVERNGHRLEHLLVKQDPFGDERCTRRDCLMCITAEKDIGQSRKTNIVFVTDCKLCRGEGGKFQY